MSKKFYFLIVAVMLFGLSPAAWGGLVARYTFDDSTATDSAYYYVDADGTFFGDATVIDDANRGKVLSLDGNGDYVKVLNNQVAEFSTESFSYSFWARSPVAGTWYYFWKGENVDANPDMILRGTNCYHDDTEVVRFSLYDYWVADDSRKKRTEVNDVNCIKDVWTHIVCVRDSALGELRFYVNGKLERPTPPPGEGNPAPDGMDVHNNGYLYIGANDRGLPTHPTNFYMGLFDDFRVYNHALSIEEIELLANDLTDPNIASDPSPENGESDACPDVVLTWTAGDNALSHNVYFGTSGADVTNATTADPEYRDNYGSATYDAGTLETLVEGVTYFWRVDEVGTSDVWKGDVWKFTINDGKANHPDPGDGVRFVPLDKILSWRKGCFASSHDVYFGTDFDDVNDATTSSSPDIFKDNQALGNTQYDPNGLDY